MEEVDIIDEQEAENALAAEVVMEEIRNTRTVPLPTDHESYLNHNSMIEEDDPEARGYLCRLIIGTSAYFYQIPFKPDDKLPMGKRIMLFITLDDEVWHK